MKKGTVKFFNSQKGFGFVTSEEGEEYFVHVSALTDQITEGDQVSFEVKQGPRGLNAINVKKL